LQPVGLALDSVYLWIDGSIEITDQDDFICGWDHFQAI
jgi:hypothetical protein